MPETSEQELLPCEIWKPVVDWPRYEVSSLGRVRNVKTGRIRKLQFSQRRGKKEYQRVSLCDSQGKSHSIKLANLVAYAFIGPRPSPEMTINHIDGIKINNTPSNLEYCTRAENLKHAARLGLRPKGDQHGSHTHPESRPRGSKSWWAKLTEAQVVEARRRYKEGGVTYKQLGEEHGVTETAMGNAISKRTWRHVK